MQRKEMIGFCFEKRDCKEKPQQMLLQFEDFSPIRHLLAANLHCFDPFQYTPDRARTESETGKNGRVSAAYPVAVWPFSI